MFSKVYFGANIKKDGGHFNLLLYNKIRINNLVLCSLLLCLSLYQQICHVKKDVIRWYK